MKKGLKIHTGHYINMENLCTFSVNENTMQIHTTGSDDVNVYTLFVKGTGEFGTLGDPIEINEFKRIEREISQYLGLEIK
jgi:hypothetical protein